MPQNTASITIEDYDGETSTTSVNVGPLTALNFTAKRAAIDAYRAAIVDLVLGAVRKTNLTEVFTESTEPVTNPQAQREAKWEVTIRDVTEFFDVADTISNVGFGETWTITIPTADLSLLEANQAELDLSGTEAAAYVTAAEAVMNSPWGGNEVQIVKIRHVGRNL